MNGYDVSYRTVINTESEPEQSTLSAELD